MLILEDFLLHSIKKNQLMKRFVMTANQMSEWTRQLRRSGEQRRKPRRRRSGPWRAVYSRYGFFFQLEQVFKVTV
jgi:hypothetical protein